MPPPLEFTMFLPPDDTLRVWDLRGELQTSVRWHEMIHEDHAAAFTVAKIARLDVLAAVRRSLDTAMREGRTFEAWRDDIVPQLKREGWWGVVQDEALTGTDEAIVVNERRLRTIFTTNIDMSRAAAQWNKIQREKERFPYLRYLSDHWREHPRQDHESWHGLIFRVDDPWWQTHFPPNGWGCKCGVQQVTESMMRDRGWTVSKGPEQGPPRPFYPAGRSDPVLVPPGIHPGFSYNPGTAHLRAIAAKANDSIDKAVEAGLDAEARRVLEKLAADPAFTQFRTLPDAPFPIQILDPEQAASIRSKVRTVRLSLPSIEKQNANHPELTDADYARLPQMVAEPEFIEPQGSRRLAFYRRHEGRWYRAAIKTTVPGDELYLLHYQYLRQEEMDRIRDRRLLFAGWSRLLLEWVGAR